MLFASFRAVPSFILLFAAFSVLGWITEVTLKYIQFHRFINRGFLIGPYCPIYGSGALMITLLADGVFMRQYTPVETFMTGFILCGLLEYFVSWYMEKTSHARWWDYSNKPMNLNGRIWIGNLILFGLAAVAIVYLADPFLFTVFNRLSDNALYITSWVFALVMLTDSVVTHFLMKIIRDCIDYQQSDDTEEIRLEMHKLLKNRTLLLRRISEAYPDLQPRPKRLMQKLEAARLEYRETSKRLKAELKEAKKAVADGRKQVSLEMQLMLQSRVRAALASKKRARERFKAIESRIFNSLDI